MDESTSDSGNISHALLSSFDQFERGPLGFAPATLTASVHTGTLAGGWGGREGGGGDQTLAYLMHQFRSSPQPPSVIRNGRFQDMQPDKEHQLPPATTLEGKKCPRTPQSTVPADFTLPKRVFIPFTPKSDQFQLSPAASPEI